MGKQEAKTARQITAILWSELSLNSQGKPIARADGNSSVDTQQYLFGQVLKARNATPNRSFQETLKELGTHLTDGSKHAKNLAGIGLTKQILEVYQDPIEYPSDQYIHRFFQRYLCQDLVNMLECQYEGDLSYLTPSEEKDVLFYRLMLATEEIVKNAAEIPGANRVLVSLSEQNGEFTMIVTENSPIKGKAKTDKILANLNGQTPKTDNLYKNIPHSGSGMGIMLSRQCLRSFYGDLVYRLNENGQIEAVATFTKYGIEHPQKMESLPPPEGIFDY